MTSRALEVRTKNEVKFGRELREKEFLFEKDWINLNHGSFGTYPRVVRDTMRAYQDAAESRPDHFIRYDYPDLVDEAREAMAKLINAPSETLVFIPNATTGINTVLRNLVFEIGDHILYFATVYGAIEKSVLYITETTPAQSVRIGYTYPVEDDWLVEQLRSKVQEIKNKGGRVKLAIFDTIVSMPGVRMPFERLTSVCKELGVLSLIDGAHGVGHIPFDFSTFNPDFFVSNCHKWLHVPRGCAIFYVPIRNQHLIRSTLPTSHGFMPRSGNVASPFPMGGGKSKYIANFEFVGTIDNAPYLCIPAAIKWRKSIGGEKVIMDYCQRLAKEGAVYVAKELGTEVLDNSTETLSQCCLTNVRLPTELATAHGYAGRGGIEASEVGFAVRDWIHRTLIDDYATFIQFVFYDGVWWARFSGQVYLEMKDFEWAAQTLKEICARVEKGEWVGKGSKL